MMKLLGVKGKDQKLFFVQVGTNRIYFEKEDEAIVLYKALAKLKSLFIDEEKVYNWDYKNLKETQSFKYKVFNEVILGQEIIEMWSSKEEAQGAKEKFTKLLKKKK